jgi:hypothetical protein
MFYIVVLSLGICFNFGYMYIIKTTCDLILIQDGDQLKGNLYPFLKCDIPLQISGILI